MVQDGLKLIGTHIGCVRDAIGYVCSSDSRIQEFNQLCKSQGLKPKKFKKDMPIRWNSTYHMLNSCRSYTNALSVFYNDKFDDNLLTEDMWNLCFKFLDFLKVFYDATCNCSDVYYPTSPIALNDLYAISLTFEKYRFESGLFEKICEVMERKYKKYWEEVPYTFCFGAIMDPRIKLTGLELILKEIEKNLSITMPLTITNIQKNINDTYKLYEKKYAAASVQGSQAPHRPSPSGSNAFSSQAVFGLLASKAKQTGVVSSCNEFFQYLDTDFTEFMTEEEKQKLDILGWWKAHSRNFPVLSIMARDVLTTPVSTVVSESAFSAGGRVLDEKRTRLTPKNLEALMCVKDWDDADLRAQSFVDEDLAYEHGKQVKSAVGIKNTYKSHVAFKFEEQKEQVIVEQVLRFVFLDSKRPTVAMEKHETENKDNTEKLKLISMDSSIRI
ncbi:zinc finger BED domain-containing protein RICESLEEPER 2-like [Rosa rugosa]|uniref:zinc finger BED domain-containing protein RICESLEEPER 2-like n=1 Tax=Rosa rugosa TaxID=74645 RepID=UPI002B401A06|nr:zinc finger BED domain-containing protein RICESLEEPER 2-like [Rosa rugosa]